MAESEFDLWGDVHPGFRAVHDLEARLPEECLWLTAPQFDHGFWTTNTNISDFMVFPCDPRHDPGIRVPPSVRAGAPRRESRVVGVQIANPSEPTARIVRRLPRRPDPADPPRSAKTMPSSVSTLVHGRWTRSDDVDPMEIAATAVFGLTMMLNGIAAPEAALPAGQVAERQYLDLMGDPVAAIGRAYDVLGLTMGPDVPDRITAYLAAKPQGHSGAHRYSLADYGLDDTTIRTELAPYIETFGVPAEN